MKQNNPNTALTVLTIIVGLLVVNYFAKNEILLWVTIAIGVLSVLSTLIRNSIHFVWMKLADLLGLIVPKIILSLIFFLVVTPLGIFYRWLSPKEQLILKNDRDTTFFEVEKKFEKSFFEKPW
jgi:cytochrome c oxidase subunit IV